MRVIPSQDERDLAAMCRSVLAAELEPAALWKALADAGVLGLAIDGSLTDVGVFCVEAGRALCPRVVQSTVYAALALDWLGVGSGWLPTVTTGETRATTALFNPRDASDVTPSLRARRDGERWRVSGVVDFVIDADVADVMLAGADVDGRAVVFVCETTALSVRPVPMMGGYPAFTVRFDDVLVDAVAVDNEQLRRVANALVALDCLDLVGVGEAVIDRTVDYTTMREQFGRPIASFQAAQHLVADMHIVWRRLDSPRSRRCSGSAGAGSQPGKRRSPGCAPRRSRRSRSTRINCTAAWATSSTPVCTCSPNAPAYCPRSAVEPTSPRNGLRAR